MIRKDEVLDQLTDDLYILQKKEGFKYGVDAVLLASFVTVHREDVLLDLGSGSGAVTFLLSQFSPKRIYGIEIQPSYVDMSQRTQKMNHLKNVKFIQGDYCQLLKYFKPDSFDTLVSNPPYFQTSLQSPVEDKRIARHEVAMSLEKLIENATKVLKEQGSFYVIYSTQRLVDLISLLRSYELEPKVIRHVHPMKGKGSNLVLVKAVKKGGKELKVLPPLYMYSAGEFTKDVLEIYRKVRMER